LVSTVCEINLSSSPTAHSTLMPVMTRLLQQGLACDRRAVRGGEHREGLSDDPTRCAGSQRASATDRKSTRLNSSHVSISYAVFCLKNKNKHGNISTLLD